jgi:hypothetical protein
MALTPTVMLAWIDFVDWLHNPQKCGLTAMFRKIGVKVVNFLDIIRRHS